MIENTALFLAFLLNLGAAAWLTLVCVAFDILCERLERGDR